MIQYIFVELSEWKVELNSRCLPFGTLHFATMSDSGYTVSVVKRYT